MPSVAYHTKTNNPDVKQLLDDPIIGRELVKKIMSKEFETVNDVGEPVEPYIKLQVGDEIIEIGVKELLSSK